MPRYRYKYFTSLVAVAIVAPAAAVAAASAAVAVVAPANIVGAQRAAGDPFLLSGGFPAFPPREVWQGLLKGNVRQASLFLPVLLRVCQTNANRQEELQSTSAPSLPFLWSAEIHLGYTICSISIIDIFIPVHLCGCICMNCIIYGHCVFNGLRRLFGPYGSVPMSLCLSSRFFYVSLAFSLMGLRGKLQNGEMISGPN